MPSRAFHHKSHHGCVICKQRKKRCDQKKPSCTACARLKLSCCYPMVLSTTWDLDSLSGDTTRQTIAASWNSINQHPETIIQPRIPDLSAADVELIHHYTVTTSATFTTIPGLFRLRRVNVVERASEYPFLLHGILAVSALHLSSHAPRIEGLRRLDYEEKARIHQHLALSSYIPQLSSINDRTCRFIFAFSAILAGLAFGFLGLQDEDPRTNPATIITNVANVFDLLTGAVTVANAAGRRIVKCRTECLVPPTEISLPPADGSVDMEAQTALTRLTLSIQESQSAERNKTSSSLKVLAVLESTILELRNAFKCLAAGEPNSFIGVISWPAFVNKSYISLLKAYHPAALVILAYYGAALHSLSYAWWLRGVGEKIACSVAEIISANPAREWQNLMCWPLERIHKPTHVSLQLTPQDPSLSADNSVCMSQGNTPFKVALACSYVDKFID